MHAHYRSPSQGSLFYTIQETADLFKVPRSTIDRWHRTRSDFPRKRKIGDNSVRFLTQEVDAYIARLTD